MGDLGLALPEAPDVVKQVQAKISPWLWILSVTGFGMALINTYRLKKMYRTAGKKKPFLL